jgi:hypothetical protein
MVDSITAHVASLSRGGLARSKPRYRRRVDSLCSGQLVDRYVSGPDQARKKGRQGFSPVNVDEVVAQRDDEHKASGKRHRDQDQPRVLPGDLPESVHGCGQCNPITASLSAKHSAQPSSISSAP